MSLQNLFKIGRIKEHPVDVEEIQKLLNAARRNLQDSRVTDISPETRFDAAYKAIMQVALAAIFSACLLSWCYTQNRPIPWIAMPEKKRKALLNQLREIIGILAKVGI